MWKTGRSSLLAILGLLVVSFTATGQSTDVYEEGFFASGKDTLHYRFLRPIRMREQGRYPVILVLHGSGERGSDNKSQLVHGGPMFASSSARNSFPAYVIFPQCPQNDTWARTTRDLDRSDSLGGIRFRSEMEPTTSMKLLMGMVDSLSKAPSVNPRKLYVGGLSMGGMGTFELLWRKPATFAAAFPICGGGDPEKVSMYREVPFWIFHGAADPVVKPGNSRRMVNALTEIGAAVQYSEYPGVEHNSWDNAFAERGLLRWLAMQSRKGS